MIHFDESNPRYLIIYTGDRHWTPDDYRQMGEHWVARLDKGERFGIIMVDEPHEHHPDQEDEDRQHESENDRLVNDFRRQHRDTTARQNVGFARVMPAEWKELYFGGSDEGWARAVQQTDVYAQYNWGIPGSGFTDFESAKAWILEQFEREPAFETSRDLEPAADSGGVGLYYGSSSGITEYVADELAELWEKAGFEPLVPVNIGKLKDAGDLLKHHNLILGIPTWNIGQLQDDWEILFPQLDSLDFTGITVAIFGVGDQYGYPDNFLDAVGILGKKLIERGARLVGYWYDGDYEFSESLAFEDGKFMGLGIDDSNQSHLNTPRLTGWIAQIAAEFALKPVAQAR